MGNCRFHHDPEDEAGPAAAAGGPALLGSKWASQGEVGWGTEELIGRWARRVQAHLLVMHDPYVCCVRRAAEIYSASECTSDDGLPALIERAGIEASTGLRHIRELVLAANGASACLTRVRLHTRGLLRDGIPAGVLLEGWAAAFNAEWQARGLLLTIVCDARIHQRRMVAQGSTTAVEVRTEWGVGIYLDNVVNSLRVSSARRVKQGEVLTLEHRGEWKDVTLPAADDGCETARDEPGTLGIDEGTVQPQRLRRLLCRWRAGRWRGTLVCDRCQATESAAGAAVRLADGRTMGLQFGGLALWHSRR